MIYRIKHVQMEDAELTDQQQISIFPADDNHLAIGVNTVTVEGPDREYRRRFFGVQSVEYIEYGSTTTLFTTA